MPSGGDERSHQGHANKVRPSSTVAPSLRSSFAMAAMRSVLTRHEAMLVSVVGPARTTQWWQGRHRRIRNVVAVERDARQAAHFAAIQLSPSRSLPHAGQRLGKSPWIEPADAPDANRAVPPMAPAARK